MDFALTSISQLEAELEPLFYALRCTHLRKVALDRKANDTLSTLTKELTVSPHTQHSIFALHLFFWAGDIESLLQLARGTASYAVEKTAAGFLARVLSADELVPLLSDLSPAARRKAIKTVAKHHRTAVADALLDPVLSRYGIEEASPLLYGCSTDVVLAHLPACVSFHSVKWDRLARRPGLLVPLTSLGKVSAQKQDKPRRRPRAGWTVEQVIGHYRPFYEEGELGCCEGSEFFQAMKGLRVADRVRVYEALFQGRPKMDAAQFLALLPGDYRRTEAERLLADPNVKEQSDLAGILSKYLGYARLSPTYKHMAETNPEATTRATYVRALFTVAACDRDPIALLDALTYVCQRFANDPTVIVETGDGATAVPGWLWDERHYGTLETFVGLLCQAVFSGSAAVNFSTLGFLSAIASTLPRFSTTETDQTTHIRNRLLLVTQLIRQLHSVCKGIDYVYMPYQDIHIIDGGVVFGRLFNRNTKTTPLQRTIEQVAIDINVPIMQARCEGLRFFLLQGVAQPIPAGAESSYGEGGDMECTSAGSPGAVVREAYVKAYHDLYRMVEVLGEEAHMYGSIMVLVEQAIDDCITIHPSSNTQSWDLDSNTNYEGPPAGYSVSYVDMVCSLLGCYIGRQVPEPERSQRVARLVGAGHWLGASRAVFQHVRRQQQQLLGPVLGIMEARSTVPTMRGPTNTHMWLPAHEQTYARLLLAQVAALAENVTDGPNPQIAYRVLSTYGRGSQAGYVVHSAMATLGGLLCSNMTTFEPFLPRPVPPTSTDTEMAPMPTISTHAAALLSMARLDRPLVVLQCAVDTLLNPTWGKVTSMLLFAVRRMLLTAHHHVQLSAFQSLLFEALPRAQGVSVRKMLASLLAQHGHGMALATVVGMLGNPAVHRDIQAAVLLQLLQRDSLAADPQFLAQLEALQHDIILYVPSAPNDSIGGSQLVGRSEDADGDGDGDGDGAGNDDGEGDLDTGSGEDVEPDQARLAQPANADKGVWAVRMLRAMLGVRSHQVGPDMQGLYLRCLTDLIRALWTPHLTRLDLADAAETALTNWCRTALGSSTIPTLLADVLVADMSPTSPAWSPLRVCLRPLEGASGVDQQTSPTLHAAVEGLLTMLLGSAGTDIDYCTALENMPKPAGVPQGGGSNACVVKLVQILVESVTDTIYPPPGIAQLAARVADMLGGWAGLWEERVLLHAGSMRGGSASTQQLIDAAVVWLGEAGSLGPATLQSVMPLLHRAMLLFAPVLVGAEERALWCITRAQGLAADTRHHMTPLLALGLLSEVKPRAREDATRKMGTGRIYPAWRDAVLSLCKSPSVGRLAQRMVLDLGEDGEAQRFY